MQHLKVFVCVYFNMCSLLVWSRYGNFHMFDTHVVLSLTGMNDEYVLVKKTSDAFDGFAYDETVLWEKSLNGLKLHEELFLDQRLG